VEITARSGNVVVGGVTVVAQADGTEPFTITLAPGRYRIHSAPALSRSVAVRPGRITDIGLFGGCTQPPATVTTVPAAGGGSTTTTTTTLPPSEIAAAPRCTTAELDVSALKFGAGLGNVAEVLAFKNVGAELCTLTGYPGVAALDARGGQVAQARRSLTAMMGGQDTGTQPMTVPLEPGHVATATVDGSDNPVGTATSCVSYPALLVTVPAETRSTVLRGIGWQGPGFAAQGFPGCTPIVVTPVVPGDTGVYP
jgi:hypothetical protein